MASFRCYHVGTGAIASLGKECIISQIVLCEKQTFPKTEAFNFESELKKRNTELITMIDNGTSRSNGVFVAAYMVLAFGKPGNTVTVHKICVQPKYRRRGLATQMMREAIARLKGRGCSKIQLWVDECNSVAISLYSKLGFHEISKVSDYYGSGRTGVRMNLSLPN